MLDIQQKRKVRAVMYNKVTLIFLSILLLIVLHSTWVVYRKKSESEELKNISLKSTEELRSRDADLKSKIDKLATPVGVEEEIRSKFSVTKESENMVVIVPDKEGEASTSVKQESLWQKFKELLGGN